MKYNNLTRNILFFNLSKKPQKETPKSPALGHTFCMSNFEKYEKFFFTCF